jgi:hypothetical protein
MSKLNRFFASFLLIVSLSVVAFAEGGETQGPHICSDPTPPPAGQVADSTENSSNISDALKTAESVTIWLLTEIF